MKYYLRFFLVSLLTCLLFSCTAATTGRKNYAVDSFASARRRDSYKVKVEKKVEGRRRRGQKRAAGEKTSLHHEQKDKSPLGEAGKEEKERSIFKPYNPNEKQRTQAKSPEGKIPADIKDNIVSAGEVEGEEYVTLNFEQAPVEEIINTISDTLGLNYIMSPGVKGQITMQTSKPVPTSELFQILQSVLEVNGLTMIPSGRYFKVVYAKEAPQHPIEVVSGKNGEDLPQEESYITQIIPLEYIPVKDMVNILQPFLSKSAPHPLQHEDLNLLIINDTALNMKRLLKFVQELDKPLYQPKQKVFVYYVENGDAKKLASTLNAIYKKTGSKQQDWRTSQATKRNSKIKNHPLRSPFLPPAWGGAGEQVQGDVTVVANEDINALIITTSPRNYPAVLETVKKLDIQPKQALIEVLVAEISIDDIKDFGLDWALSGSASGGVSYNVGQYLGGIPKKMTDPVGYGDGISYMLRKQDKFLSLINTKASENKLNVLSSPHIMASDNQEASIEITKDYPIPRDSYDQNNNKTTTYEYKNAGIKLNFTPKINDKGLVNLKLTQEVSQLAPGSGADGDYIFSTRKADTSVVVHDGETLVIGGLIKEQKSKARTGIPFLGDIPILGYLFSHTTDTINKTELIILITPHVIKNEAEEREITRKFQNRVKGLKTKINQTQGIGTHGADGTGGRLN